MAGRQNYQTLRDEQARAAMNALDQHVEQSETPNRQAGVEQPAPEQSAEVGAEQDPQPIRPEAGRGSSPGWTDMGGMAQQQASATTYNNWIVADLDARDQSRGDNPIPNVEQSAANAELNQHVEGQERGDQGAGDRAGRSQEAASKDLQEYIERSESEQIKSDFRETALEVQQPDIER